VLSDRPGGAVKGELPVYSVWVPNRKVFDSPNRNSPGSAVIAEAVEAALILERQDRIGEALEVLEATLQLEPESAAVAKQCARLSLKINEIRAFINWCHEALRIDESDPEPHEMMGALLESKGRHAEAQEEFRMAAAVREKLARMSQHHPKLRWGVLSVSKFAMTKLLPATMKSSANEITAVASRDLGRATEAAAQLGAGKAYGSYEELLADPDIDVIYNPLPNHLHVPWAIKAAEAGKHVLCEKPLGLNAAQVRELIAARDRTGKVVMEAFMVRTHPQWLRVREIIRSGEIGDVRAFVAAFSYTNVDPNNVRNKADIGGGALYDIGCYCITTARWAFEREPQRVACTIERDPAFGTDRLSSALLDFAPGQATFTVSTQINPFQRTQIIGTKGRIEVEIPVNSLTDRPMRLHIDVGGALDRSGIRTEEIPACDQYTIQADELARAIRGERDAAVPLEDSLANVQVIDAAFSAAESGRWEVPGTF
jgi:predicted dehydrogenase